MQNSKFFLEVTFKHVNRYVHGLNNHFGHLSFASYSSPNHHDILITISHYPIVILLAQIYRVQSINYEVLVSIYCTSHQLYTDIYVVNPTNYQNKYTTIQCIKMKCRHFGLSMFWPVDVSIIISHHSIWSQKIQ